MRQENHRRETKQNNTPERCWHFLRDDILPIRIFPSFEEQPQAHCSSEIPKIIKRASRSRIAEAILHKKAVENNVAISVFQKIWGIGDFSISKYLQIPQKTMGLCL